MTRGSILARRAGPAAALIMLALVAFPTPILAASVGVAPADEAAPPTLAACTAVKVPQLVDECGDTMRGDLALATGAAIAFPAGRLAGDLALTFDGRPICVAHVATSGCASGGDVTSVVAGAGLLGGGAAGDLTLAVDTGQIQSRVTGACGLGQYVRGVNANGSVTCGADATGAGTLTRITAGPGLTGGAITTNGTIAIANGGVTGDMIANGAIRSLNVDATTVQLRVNGACASGQFITSIGQDGSVGCDVDRTNVYTAGDGLVLSGSTFRVDTNAIQQRVIGSCATGTYVQTVNWDGSLTCAPDETGSNGTVTRVATGAGLTGGPITGSGTIAIAANGVTSALIDPTTVQQRVSGACNVGSYVRSINQDGTVVCGTDKGSFIQNQTAGAQTADAYITGTYRTSGFVRTGTETGTTQDPSMGSIGSYGGMEIRRVRTTLMTLGNIVARTDALLVERDGTAGGFLVAWAAPLPGNQEIACMGVNAAGTARNKVIALASGTAAGSQSIYVDADGVVSFSCTFGDPYDNAYETTLQLERYGTDLWWVGHLVTTYDQ